MACPTLGTTCGTQDQLIALVPSFANFGGTSRGVITLDALTIAGDLLVIGDITLTAVAGVAAVNEWSIDGTITDQANSIVIAIVGGPLLSYVVPEKIFGQNKINITTILEGGDSAYPWSTTSANITLSPADTLEGGECDLQFYLDLACSMLDPGCWGNKLTPASLYLAAHMIQISEDEDVGTASGRAIASVSESYNFNSPDPADAWWANTPNGRLYLGLYYSLGPKLPIVGGGLIPRNWPNYGGRYGRRFF